jgi:hypothetical protein
METEINKLYDTILKKRGVQLTEVQSDKFRWACEKAIVENPEFTFSDWVIAGQIYLNLILRDPNLELGQIVLP